MMPDANVLRITTHVYGTHSYPDAPAEVAYLRFPHRHRFGISIVVPVARLDREIEFHQQARALAATVALCYPTHSYPGLIDFGHHSVEQIADRLLAHPTLHHVAAVIVDEDGEHSATVRRTP